MSALILNFDDCLKLCLDALAARNCKPLPDWATEQLSRLAADAEDAPANAYSGEWMEAFGSISGPTFHAPSRPLPSPVEPLDAEP